MLKNSKIYVGKVIHRRFKPKNHYFKYRVFSLLIDLDDLNEIDNKIKLFSYNKFNIISFFYNPIFQATGFIIVFCN